MTTSKRRELGLTVLLLLIGCTLLLDFYHGIQLGQHRVAYQPIYRLRQSLAVAISRLHHPPSSGYLAYKSVVDVFNANGFALLDGEPGPHLGPAGWEALLDDGPRLDRIISDASNVSIDPSLPPDIIQGNELGLADYMSLSFRLFGANISSLYYFFFLIAAATCLLYALQFRDRPFLLFLLVVFLAELYFLENYASSFRTHMNTMSNSRLFSGLALLPALHVLFVLWQRQPPRPFAVTAVFAQSMIFAFLSSCRNEVGWQFAMVIAIGCGIGLSLLLPRQENRFARLLALWPAAIFAVVVAAYSISISRAADARYAAESTYHVFWHEVLMGILSTDPQLRQRYVGNTLRTYGDEEVYTAVIRDLNARDDATSPIARRLGDGRLTIDLMRGWGEYDKLVRSLTLRIIYRHPLAVLGTIPTKIGDQIGAYTNPLPHGMSWQNLRIAVIIVAAAAFVCMAAGGFDADRQALRDMIFLVAIVLLFALATPMIHPSGLAIGTLFSYLGAIAISAAYGAQLLMRTLTGIKSRRENVSLGAEPTG